MSIERLLARRRRMPPEAVFSGHTAAWLHGLDLPPCKPIEVTLPVKSTTSHLTGTRLTRSDFTMDETCEVRGLPATAAARTVADLGRRLTLIEAVVVIDMALRRRLVELDELRCWADQHARYRGCRRLIRALELADGDSESPMETRLRVLLVLDGLPKPLVQVPIYDESGQFIARPDLCYPQQRLVIEYDGATHRESLGGDNRRQNKLVDAGYRVLRFTAGDLIHRPASVVELVRRALSLTR
jgi:very-short-patch-repair endonuclease